MSKESWLMDPLIRVAKKGVRVTIHTRSPSTFQEKSKEWQSKNIQQLRSYKFEVVERDQMHEKACIIDSRIAYLGTMNLLSRREPEKKGDYMLKYESPELVKFFAGMLELMAWESEE
ncbi:MAG: phospholipase D-like domain-containing protein [Candidatus Asgardarchaeia archaeon]